MAQAIGNPASKKTKEEKKRKWKDTNESVKFVCERGKVMCPFCSIPVGNLKVTSNTISLQDVYWMTSGDRNGKVNLDFKGTCTHPSQKNPPCKAVINLGKWENTSDVHINNHYALLVKSTIPCMISGMNLKLMNSGQMALLTRVDLISPKRLTIAPDSNKIRALYVCHELRYIANYTVYGEIKENNGIRWKVKIGEAENVKLEDVKEIIKTKCQLTGKEINFPVPMEWRYKKILLTAYIEYDKEVAEVTGMEIFIKDHFAAAFYRIDAGKANFFAIKNVKSQPGTGHIYPVNALGKKLPPPLFHLQGMYKTGNQFYFSGSTNPLIPAYIVSVNQCDATTGCYDNFNVIRLNERQIERHTHPGGIQAANGILAVGLEKYDENKFFLSTKTNTSFVCFYDTKETNAPPLLSFSRDEDTEIASAVAIVSFDNNWIVAVRGNKGSIQFYKIGKSNNILKLEVTMKKIPKVGDFQNINLFLDENNDMYLFGMGDEEICKIYRVVLDGNVVTGLMAIYLEDGYLSQIEDVKLEDGYIIQAKKHDETEKNKKIFSCVKGASFHWASCVSIQKNEDTGIESVREEEPDFIGNEATGFIGKFTVYASGENIHDSFSDDIYGDPKDPKIDCNYFTEP
jgi:hypothetical protein